MWDKLKEQFNLLKLEKKKLYLITNSDKFQSRDNFLDAIASSLQGGVDIVQLRQPNTPDNIVVDMAHKIRALCDEFGATFIVNDRADIARIVEADGVHLGQQDISVRDAREVAGKNAIVGKSVCSINEAVEAVNEGADYIILCSVYNSVGKPDINYINKVNGNIDIPVFVSGEINLNNVNELIQNGVKKIALTEAVMYAQIPEETARKFLTYLP